MAALETIMVTLQNQAFQEQLQVLLKKKTFLLSECPTSEFVSSV